LYVESEFKGNALLVIAVTVLFAVYFVSVLPVIPEIVTPPTLTKEELLAQLLAIQAQIEALK
jgi:hypothetical protein